MSTNTTYFEISNFDSLTFDPLTVGQTKTSPWTLLLLCPCRTRWHFYFCNLKYFIFWPIEKQIWPFDPRNDLCSGLKNTHILKMHCSNLNLQILLSSRGNNFFWNFKAESRKWPLNDLLTSKTKISCIHHVSMTHMWKSCDFIVFTAWDKNSWTFLGRRNIKVSQF